MTRWLEGKGPDDDIVISSRIRLARNLENISFLQNMNEEESKHVRTLIKDAILNSNSTISREFDYFEMENIEILNRKVLVEKHLISPGLLEKPNHSAFLLRQDEKVTIMINEEDHIRMQVLSPGLDLEKDWDLCSKIDDILDENLKYAFDEKFGYITACPTNVGTGLRASVMLHLPSLVLTKYINKVLQAVSQIGLTVRGLYGEGTDVMGNLFQISNQTTLGKTEEEIIEKLRNIVSQIVDKERASRETLFNTKKIYMEDKIFRSLGILQSARIMSSKESMDLLSDLRIGIDMGIVKDININTVNNLMISMQPASIQKYTNHELNSRQRDVKRADLIRKELKI